MSDVLRATIIISILSATIRMATPLLLAALGELVAERSGVMNLGVEGMMLMGAYIGFWIANITGSLVLGILAGIVAGGLMSLIMAVMAATLKVDQTVTGLAINLLANGLTYYWYRITYRSDIYTPTTHILQPIPIPLLSKIPYIGEILFTQNLLTYLAFLMVPVIWLFLNRTKYGLIIRCLGENPRAVDMKGANVTLLQYLSVLFGGMMAGLAGAFLTLGTVGLFVPEISNGRGWLAIVILIAGNWMPNRILIAALIFAFLDAFQLQMQGLGVQLPYQLFLALPYVCAIIAVMSSRARSQAPQALGLPYTRE